MPGMVRLFMPVFVYIYRLVPVLQVQVNLEKGLPPGALNSRIAVILAARIIALGSIDHG